MFCFLLMFYCDWVVLFGCWFVPIDACTFRFELFLFCCGVRQLLFCLFACRIAIHVVVCYYLLVLPI